MLLKRLEYKDFGAVHDRLCDALPIEVRERYAQFLRREMGKKHALPDEHGTVELFLEWLDQMAIIFLDETGRFGTSPTSDKKRHRHAVMVTADTSAGDGACPVCKKEHSGDFINCKDWKKLPVGRKYNILREDKRCYRCLGKHFKVKCKKPLVECAQAECGKDHHIDLCSAFYRMKFPSKTPAKRLGANKSKASVNTCDSD